MVSLAAAFCPLQLVVRSDMYLICHQIVDSEARFYFFWESHSFEIIFSSIKFYVPESIKYLIWYLKLVWKDWGTRIGICWNFSPISEPSNPLSPLFLSPKKIEEREIEERGDFRFWYRAWISADLNAMYTYVEKKYIKLK